MQVVIFLLGLAVVVLVMWAVLALTRRQREKLEQTFQRAAEAVGGEYLPGETRLFSRISPKVQLMRDEGIATADTHVVSSGDNSTTYTRVTAGYVGGQGPALHIRRQRALHGLGKALGMQDLVIGDEPFDDAYMIKGPSEPVVRRVLEPRTRQALHAIGRWWVRATESALTVERVGYVDDPDELGAAMEIALAIATSERRLLTSLVVHPSASWGRDGRSLVLHDRDVRGDFVLGQRGCTLRVAHDREGPEIGIDCGSPGAARELPAGLLEPALAAQVGRIGDARLGRDRQHAWVAWRNAPDPAQLEAAWSVLVALAESQVSVGAFR